MKRLLAAILLIAMTVSLVACAPKGNSEYTQLNCVFLGSPPASKDLELVQEEMNKIAREKIGAELNITFLDAGTMTEKLNAMMGSGAQIDVVWTGYAFSYENCVRNGGLYDISELIDQTPGIKEHVPDYALNQCYMDDGLYGVPNMQILCSYWCYSFPKWLVEKYNFDYTQVKCIEDLEPYLAAVKAGNEDIYLISDSELMGTWTEKRVKDHYYNPYDTVMVDLDTGELMWTMDVPAVMQRLELARDWYLKGYIRPDIMTARNGEADKAAGKVAVWASVGKPGIDADLYTRYGYETVSVPITTPVLGSPTSTMMCVGANTVDPLKSLQVIELLNTDVEFHNLAVFGVEGVHYNFNDAGRVEIVEGSGYNQSLYSWALGDQFITYLLPNQEEDVWEITKNMNDNAAPNPTAGFVIPSDIRDELKIEEASLTAIGSEYAWGLRFGVYDLDKVLPEYRERSEDLHYTVTDTLQDYVEEWFANKNKG